jgi:ubiquinone biosynthesis UbiH/UbiF/VisC/COQ6 family hydroxylase
MKKMLYAQAARRRLPCRLFSTFSDVYDVLIIGGGVVGSGLASLLKDTSIKVGLLERGPPPKSGVSEIPHPRCYALSPFSMELLGENVVSKSQPAYYDSMQVWEQDSPSLVMFNSKDLEGTMNTKYLGAVVEDAPLVAALWDEIQGRVDCVTDAQVHSLNMDGNVVHVTTQSSNENNERQSLSARLVVAADGANSWVRRDCNIGWEGFDYNRTALTCTVQLDKPMPRRAYQRFLPEGPLALLPTHSPNHATIVWSTTPEQAQQYKESSSDDLVAEINSVLQQGPQQIPPLFPPLNDGILGNIVYGMERVVDTVQYGLTMAHWNDHDEVFSAPPLVENIAGPRLSFPLSCRHAATYVHQNRIALVGDAAHTVHPMAGQGLNLGLQDVAALVKCVTRAHDAGMDVATFLGEYGTQQRLQNSLRINGIHALHELFGNQSSILQHSKSLGMHAVNHVGPLRRHLAAVAAGAPI